MAKRKSLKKSIRFEVLKRDSFTCQYCGAKAPEVLLQVDHIHPVAKGGENDMLNLTTSCEPCNNGKGAKTLDDSTVVAKQVDQLADLQARREQLDELFRWKQGLGSIEDDALARVAGVVQQAFRCNVTESGLQELKKSIRKYSVAELLDAIPVAADEYLRWDGGEKPTNDSMNMAFDKLGGICRLRRVEKDKPYMRDLFYIRGILRNRLSYLVEYEAIRLLERAHLSGADIDYLKSLALECSSWSVWRGWLQDIIDEAADAP